MASWLHASPEIGENIGAGRSPDPVVGEDPRKRFVNHPDAVGHTRHPGVQRYTDDASAVALRAELTAGLRADLGIDRFLEVKS
jgi:hypothetical protein